MRSVSFSYERRGPAILRDITFAVNRGETIAIVGPSGSGKTTIAKLLLGWRRPTSGVLEVNGQNINQIDLDSWRRRIAFVPQDTHLFRGTIRDNITLLSPEITEDRLAAAIAIAELDLIFRHHPRGLDTMVGPGAVELSGGQRQRVAVARAVARDADLVIFDEMTHKLDVASQQRIVQNIRGYCDSRSVVVIAHQPEMLALADRIYSLRNGILVECLLAVGQNDFPGILERSASPCL